MELSVIVLIVSFVILLALSVPIAIAIGISTILTMLFTIPSGPAITTVAQQMATGINSFALLAIPFFILSGQLMGRGGIARRLVDFAKVLVGMFPGGLAYVNVLACMFFGAISGSAAAATSAIGGFMIPRMNKEGYDKNFNTAVTVTGATTGLLIPPSNVLIVYSLASGGVSIAALFIAGYFPGILVGLGLMAVCAIVALIKKYPVGDFPGWLKLTFVYLIALGITGLPVFSFINFHPTLLKWSIPGYINYSLLGYINWFFIVLVCTHSISMASVTKLVRIAKFTILFSPAYLIYEFVRSQYTSLFIIKIYIALVIILTAIWLLLKFARKSPALYMIFSIVLMILASIYHFSLQSLLISKMHIGLLFIMLLLFSTYYSKIKNHSEILLKEAKVFIDAIPSLLLIVIVIGGILAGYFTATEASAVAVLYALLLSVVFYREVKIKDLPQILLKTVETTAIVMLLIGTSRAMSWILSYENIPQNISAALVGMTDSKFLILLMINCILLIVGTFMDMTPAVLIFTPIFLPIVKELGMSPLHFGIVMVLNLCIGLCTPPVGSVLFLGCGIGKTTIASITKSLLPFFAVMILSLLLVTYIPWIVEVLPKLFGYSF